MSHHLSHRFTILIAAASSLGLLTSGCRQAASPPQMAPPTVTIAPIEQREVIEWDEFTGRTAAIENVEVRPRVSGHIEQVKFDSGQLVKKGDVLFQIDSRWYQTEFNRREADYQQAKVKAANLEAEAKRSSQLLATKAISTELAEQRQARFQEAQAALLSAQAGREAAQLDLEYTQIRSPIDGRVSRALVTTGNYVSGFAGNATLLTTIVSVDPIHVYADVDENSLLKFNALVHAQKLVNDPQGKVPVELQLADESGFPHQGWIESFDNKLDPNTGSILLRAIIPNPDGRIVPGLFARIRIPGSEKHQALLIDETSIGTDQAQKFVLSVTSSNTVAYRPVKLGPSWKGKRIVREGLAAGEKIVVNGLQRARPGMPVTPQTETAPGAGAAKVAQQ